MTTTATVGTDRVVRWIDVYPDYSARAETGPICLDDRDRGPESGERLGQFHPGRAATATVSEADAFLVSAASGAAAIRRVPRCGFTWLRSG
jgi:hypothetical protein